MFRMIYLALPIKPLLNEESVWKAHALILMDDYYFSKKSFFKAKEFYNEIMNK